jgi:NAD(P)-dependent dehydrogenase (short-subunit alcohol dehydrogenase family)
MSVKSEPEAPMPKQEQPRPGLDSAMDPKPRFEAPEYKAAGKLKDKVALITGGDSGIGKAVANLYAREGADVAIVYLKAEQSDAEETKRVVEAAGRRCLLLPGDVTDPKFCRQAVERTVTGLGKLDILVNNAA